MRTLRFTFSVLMIVLMSCSDNDDPSPSSPFKDQDAQGKIGNVNWTFKTGFGNVGTEVLSVTLLATDTDPCTGMPEGNQLFFDVPDQVGVYTLKMDWNDLLSEDNQTVTLFDDSDGMNYLADQGSIEILTITDSEITGRLDAYAEDGAFVNGNFSVTICK